MTVASALIREGKQLGLQEGLEKGLETGLRKGRQEVARNMLQSGIAAATVAKLTRLPVGSVKKLKP